MKTMTKAQFIELMNNGDRKTKSGYELFPGVKAGDLYLMEAWVTSRVGDILVMFTLSFDSYDFESEDEIYNKYEEVELVGVQIVDANGDKEYMQVEDLPANLKDVDIKYVLEEGRRSYKAALKAFEEEERDEILGFEYQEAYRTMTMGSPHTHTDKRNIAGSLRKFDSVEDRDIWIEQTPPHYNREAKTFQQARKVRMAMDTSEFEDHVEKMSYTEVDLECEYEG